MFVKSLGVFFAASTHLCYLLKKVLGGKLIFKRLIDVRCSAHADAANAPLDDYSEIQSALNQIVIETKSLSAKMDKF